MIIFVAFVAIVLLGLVLQWQTQRWQAATGVPCILFIALLLTDNLFPDHGTLAFTLGLPMVFFAGLLGSFLYETRLNPNRHESTEHETAEVTVEPQSSDEQFKP